MAENAFKFKAMAGYGSKSLSSDLKIYDSTGQSIKIKAEKAKVMSTVMILSFIVANNVYY